MARKRSCLGRLVWSIASVLAIFLIAGIVAVAAFRLLNPPTTAFMADARLTAWLNDDANFAFRHEWVGLAQISPNLPLAVVASEDQKFPEHRGFDVQAIEKAYSLNQHSHRLRGASTISQQVAKNVFLWSGRSYFRKALEAYFTVLIETLWPKRRILEVYLNVAQFGYGTYGAEAAAQRYFHKPASRLTRSDAATLAAVLPAPERYSVASPSRFIQQRREWILGQMQALGGPEMLEEIDALPSRRP